MWRILLVIGVLSASAPAAVAAPCLAYEHVSLSGRLARQVYAGPPDYESVTSGDEPQFIWVLLLDRGICVVDPDPALPRRYRQIEIQLAVGARQLTPFRTLLGENVIVSGKLRPGGARDDKWLVLAEVEIKRAPVQPVLR